MAEKVKVTGISREIWHVGQWIFGMQTQGVGSQKVVLRNWPNSLSVDARVILFDIYRLSGLLAKGPHPRGG